MWSLLVGAVAWAAPCGGDVAGVVEALATVDPEMRVELATAGLAQLCPGQPALAGAARSVTESPPDFRAVLDLKAIAENPVHWMAVCDGGLGVAQRIAQVAPGQKRLVVWKDCGLADRGWFTETDWLASEGLIGLALVGGQVLQESGVDGESVRAIVRGLAGVDSDAPVTRPDAYGIPQLVPVQTFEDVEGREPPPDLLGGVAGGPLGGAAVDRPAGFVERPQVKWSRAAKRSERRVCKVEVTVWKVGVYGRLKWIQCPEDLRKPVQKALEAAKYEAAIEDGKPVKGSFKTRFAIKD